ncbi:hypothetical protein ACJX0J_037218, partial [Zea mays]
RREKRAYMMGHTFFNHFILFSIGIQRSDLYCHLDVGLGDPSILPHLSISQNILVYSWIVLEVAEVIILGLKFLELIRDQTFVFHILVCVTRSSVHAALLGYSSLHPNPSQQSQSQEL